MHQKAGIALILLLCSCDRADLQADRNILLQKEIEKLQLRVNELETEAGSCHTSAVQQQRSNEVCEAGLAELDHDLQCAETQRDQPADLARLGLEPGERLGLSLDTSLGLIECDLLHTISPRAVESFVDLVKARVSWTHPTLGTTSKKPIYADTLFHRVIPGFMIQGGDPIGTGTGNPGFTLPDEFECSPPFTEPGMLALANSNRPNSAGSQFFITTAARPDLNGRYTVLGRCDNLDVVQSISASPRDDSDRPLKDVRLKRAWVDAVTASK